jgi:ribosome-associated protein
LAKRAAPRRPKGPTPLQLARLLRAAAVDKKAWDCVVLDVRDKTSLADYFVVCEGETDRQVRAIADGMMEKAKEKELRPLGIDGYDDAGWILLDFDSVLAHVFLPGERSYYDLEGLWAPKKARANGVAKRAEQGTQTRERMHSRSIRAVEDRESMHSR